jgi:hypothetical protein
MSQASIVLTRDLNYSQWASSMHLAQLSGDVLTLMQQWIEDNQDKWSIEQPVSVWNTDGTVLDSSLTNQAYEFVYDVLSYLSDRYVSLSSFTDYYHTAFVYYSNDESLQVRCCVLCIISTVYMYSTYARRTWNTFTAQYSSLFCHHRW